MDYWNERTREASWTPPVLKEQAPPPPGREQLEELVPVDGFEGPLVDDVPGPGSMANLQVSSLNSCASMCRTSTVCMSFEYSQTVGRDPRKVADASEGLAALVNCHLNLWATPRSKT